MNDVILFLFLLRSAIGLMSLFRVLSYRNVYVQNRITVKSQQLFAVTQDETAVKYTTTYYIFKNRVIDIVDFERFSKSN